MRRAGKFTCWVLICQVLLAALYLTAEETGGSPEKEAAVIAASISRVESLRNEARYDEALAIGLEALRKAEEIGNDPLITESMYQISLIYYFLESYEEAGTYMEIGLTHARLHKLESLEADLLNAQGVMQWKQGNLFEATAKLTAALEIKQRQNQWVSMASISNNLGIIAYSMQRYAEAVNHYRQGLEWLGDHENPRMRASLYSNLGESLVLLGMFETAETYLMQALEIEKEFNEPHSLAYTYFNLGELRSGQGNSREAIELYQKALEMQVRIGNEWSAALTRLRLSQEHLDNGRPEQAIADILPGYESVKRLNTLTLLRDYANQLSRIYASMGDEGLARYYKDLKEWFGARAEEKDTAEGLKLSRRAVNESVPIPVPPEPDLSFVRIGTLSLLAVLILILVIENVRLRRQMKNPFD